jgi:O-antigen biosynthesis protein
VSIDMGAETDGALIRVWLVAPPRDLDVRSIRLAEARPHEAAGFAFTTAEDDRDLWVRLAEHRPHVIVTFGNPDQHRELSAAPLGVRRRWLDEASPGDPSALARRILAAYVANLAGDRFPEQPLVSVVTPTFRTGSSITGAYRSLLSQTYPEWEWVVYDDSDDGGATFTLVDELARRDPRVRAFRGAIHDGSIGSVKRTACGLADGRLVVELDHDDRILPRCLERVVQAAHSFPEAGFFYSDAADVLDDGTPASFGEDWAFGFGHYRREVIDGSELMVQCYPPVNSKTIRHITGAPNHVRAWRADAYWACGGHRRDLMVADDHDLCIRMFLTTRMVHIPECCYVQTHRQATDPDANAQRRRNREIQRLTNALLALHGDAIHERFVDLGVDDFIWTDDGALDWTRPGPPDGAPANLVLQLDAPPDLDGRES